MMLAQFRPFSALPCSRMVRASYRTEGLFPPTITRLRKTFVFREPSDSFVRQNANYYLSGIPPLFSPTHS